MNCNQTTISVNPPPTPKCDIDCQTIGVPLINGGISSFQDGVKVNLGPGIVPQVQTALDNGQVVKLTTDLGVSVIGGTGWDGTGSFGLDTISVSGMSDSQLNCPQEQACYDQHQIFNGTYTTLTIEVCTITETDSKNQTKK